MLAILKIYNGRIHPPDYCMSHSLKLFWLRIELPFKQAIANSLHKKTSGTRIGFCVYILLINNRFYDAPEV